MDCRFDVKVDLVIFWFMKGMGESVCFNGRCGYCTIRGISLN